jgi:thymidine kinase
MATAEYVTKVHAICKRTGNLANYSMRILKEKFVELGETESYEAVSRRVFIDEVLSKRKIIKLEWIKF